MNKIIENRGDVSFAYAGITDSIHMLIERLGTSCTAVYNGLAESYTITYNPVRSAGISKDALERLKDEHPDIYDQYVTVSEWRRFHVKKAALQAA